jgi:alpha,alpha-trehalase
LSQTSATVPRVRDALRPVSSWSLEFEGYEPDREGLRETLCTLGNGYFATRGSLPEEDADGVHYPGTYAAGAYNRLETTIADRRVANESLVNLPNWLSFAVRIEGGDWFDIGTAELLEHRHRLDLRRAVLVRELRFRDAESRVTHIVQRRLVSMDDPHLAALETVIFPENWSGRLEVRSALDGRVANRGVARYRDLASEHLRTETARAGDIALLVVETVQSRIRVAEAARTRVLQAGRPVDVEAAPLEAPSLAGHDLAFEVAAGSPVTVEKVVCLYTSRDPAISECGYAAERAIRRAPPFETLLERQILAWEHLWRRFGFAIDEGERTQLVVNLHVFHLLQSVSTHTADFDAGAPARGLHGEAYHGHVFWDELFVLPVLNLRDPRLSRALLRYRYRRLPEAREAARAAGYAGAMFPWQSGSSGEEETQRLHLNPRSGRWNADYSYLQRHVNLAVAYNVWQQHEVTGDLEFVAEAAELFLEIARFWASAATYAERLDRYEIAGVMGPDEYHDAYPGAAEPGLRNNAYTNVMAVWVLCRALDLLDFLPAHRRDELWNRLGLTREEVDRWDKVSRKMRLLFHADGVLSQFEGYADLEELDWEGYRTRYGDISRLDRILEAEGDTPNRYKVSKQADVLMLFYLLSADELRGVVERLGYTLAPEAIPRTVEYYLERTSHGSTLSALVHAWVLARSDRPRSWQYFQQVLESDISDLQGGTTPEGIHLGAIAGTLDLLQRCFTGLEVRGNVLWVDPLLPDQLRRLEFDLRYRGHWLRLTFDAARARIVSSPSPAGPVTVGFRREVRELAPGDAVEFELR